MIKNELSIELHSKLVEKYLIPILRRAYKYGKRWDEGAWRVLELSALNLIISGNFEEPILDVGCGNGDVFELFFGSGIRAHGIDLYSSALGSPESRARYSLGISVEDARQMSFANESFRMVFSNSVLEHIDNVDFVLSDVYRVLARNGQFVFTTPTPALRSKRFYFWRKFLAPIGLDWLGIRLALREDRIYHHVSIRSFDEWRVSLNRAGFKIIERFDYVPEECALLISKYSGATRVKNIVKLIGTLFRDQLFYYSFQDLSEDKWVQFYSAALKPYLRLCLHGEPGCGQVIVAYKS